MLKIPPAAISLVLFVSFALINALPIIINPVRRREYDFVDARWSTVNNKRDNWTILSSCLLTTFICTWTVFHPEIHRLRGWQARTAYRFLWFCVGVIMPEFIAIAAMSQFLKIFLARKRGATCECQKYGLERNCHTTQHLPYRWSLTQCFYADMGGLCARITTREGIYPEQKLIQLDLNCVIQLCDEGHDTLLEIQQDEIEDRSKANWFTKAIALFQTIWFVAQVCGRGVVHLPISNLEFVTLAYIVTALLTMIFWWAKPMDIFSPTVITIDPQMADQTLFHYRGGNAELLDEKPRTTSYVLRRSLEREIQRVISPAGNSTKAMDWAHFFLMGFVSAIFGTFHIIPVWCESYFPTMIEMWLWLVASLCTALLPSCLYVLYYGPLQSWEAHSSLWSKQIKAIIIYSIGTLYFCSRFYLIVDPFFGLRRVPAGLYDQLSWVQFWPHIN